MNYQIEGLWVFFSIPSSLLNFELEVKSYGHSTEAFLVKAFHLFENRVFWSFPYPTRHEHFSHPNRGLTWLRSVFIIPKMLRVFREEFPEEKREGFKSSSRNLGKIAKNLVFLRYVHFLSDCVFHPHTNHEFPYWICSWDWVYWESCWVLEVLLLHSWI